MLLVAPQPIRLGTLSIPSFLAGALEGVSSSPRVQAAVVVSHGADERQPVPLSAMVRMHVGDEEDSDEGAAEGLDCPISDTPQLALALAGSPSLPTPTDTDNDTDTDLDRLRPASSSQSPDAVEEFLTILQRVRAPPSPIARVRKLVPRVADQLPATIVNVNPRHHHPYAYRQRSSSSATASSVESIERNSARRHSRRRSGFSSEDGLSKSRISSRRPSTSKTPSDDSFGSSGWTVVSPPPVEEIAGMGSNDPAVLPSPSLLLFPSPSFSATTGTASTTATDSTMAVNVNGLSVELDSMVISASSPAVQTKELTPSDDMRS